jgi:hypothetical protein
MQTTYEISNVARQLYDSLKELYEQIDHNEKLKEGEFIMHEIKYSYKMQEKLKRALDDYDNCLSIYK